MVQTHQTVQTTRGEKRQGNERLVVPVDLARQLRVCGWTAPTVFSWHINPYMEIATLHFSSEEFFGKSEDKIPAPLASELKERFPTEVWITVQRNLKRVRGMFYFSLFGGKHICSLMVRTEGEAVYEFHREEGENEAEAVGRMLAFVWQNKMQTS